MKRICRIVVGFSLLAVGTAWAGESFFAGASLQSALEYNRTDVASTWVDPDTGQSGSTVPTRTFQNAAGQPCREFTQTIFISGEPQQGYGTACRQADGSWRIVDDGSAVVQPVQVPPTRVVYVRQEPVRYVYADPYPWRPYYRYGYDPYYFPVNLALSFGYIYRSGHGGGHGHHR